MMNIGRPPNTEADFWGKVDSSDGPTACWPYLGAKGRGGYGYWKWGGRSMRAHRAAYEFAKGSPGRLFVCHTCDNPVCCNPGHLFAGTAKDNALDRGRKNRHAHGSRGGLAKLSESDIPTIRDLRKQGLSQQKIADKYGVAQTIIARILLRQIWTHVPVG